MGGTDCALPMLWAARQKLNVSGFVTYTDSETWFGQIHPFQALRQYREATGIPGARPPAQAYQLPGSRHIVARHPSGRDWRPTHPHQSPCP